MNTPILAPTERVLTITRVFDASRDLVWKAWTDQEQAKHWWGPRHHPSTHVEIDARVGGKWRFVNKHPKGEAEFYGVYKVIDPPGRIVFTEIYAPFPDAESIVTAVFTEENGKTRLTASCTYPSREVRDTVMKSGMEKGAALSYDRLEEVALELARIGA